MPSGLPRPRHCDSKPEINLFHGDGPNGLFRFFQEGHRVFKSGRLYQSLCQCPFQLADEQGRVDAVAGDLRAILDLIGSSEDFARFVSSPAISRDDQAAAVNAILEKAGADELVQKFIGVVAENGRLFALKAIIDQFLADLAARRGEVSAEVISATALDADLEDEVKKAVAKVAGSDKSFSFYAGRSVADWRFDRPCRFPYD